jgi:hypothetical protein
MGLSVPPGEPRAGNESIREPQLKEPGNIAKMKPLAQAWWRGWDRANAILNRSYSKPVEFWLWWFTDASGRRRRTPYRMSREEALERYPDAESSKLVERRHQEPGNKHTED